MPPLASTSNNTRVKIIRPIRGFCFSLSGAGCCIGPFQGIWDWSMFGGGVYVPYCGLVVFATGAFAEGKPGAKGAGCIPIGAGTTGDGCPKPLFTGGAHCHANCPLPIGG